jgi:hypothetical protein
MYVRNSTRLNGEKPETAQLGRPGFMAGLSGTGGRADGVRDWLAGGKEKRREGGMYSIAKYPTTSRLLLLPCSYIVFLFPGSRPSCLPACLPAATGSHHTLWSISCFDVIARRPAIPPLMYVGRERESIREVPDKKKYKQSNQQKGTNGKRCNLPARNHGCYVVYSPRQDGQQQAISNSFVFFHSSRS